MKLVGRLTVVVAIWMRSGAAQEDTSQRIPTMYATNVRDTSTDGIVDVEGTTLDSIVDTGYTTYDSIEDIEGSGIDTTNDGIKQTTQQSIPIDTTTHNVNENMPLETITPVVDIEETTHSTVAIADYTFSNTDSLVDIQMELLTDSTVQIVCSFQAQNEQKTFQGDLGVPQIWLIRDHTSCSGLTGTVLGQKIGTINKSGHASSATTLTWDQLPGKCLLIVQRNDTVDVVIEDQFGTTTEIVNTSETITEIFQDAIITTTDSNEETTSTSKKLFEDATVAYKYFVKSTSNDDSVLTIYPITRTFSTLDLSLYSIFASGSTGAFTIPSVVISKPISFYTPSVVSVPYNKWNTLPLLQLPGWSTSTSYYIAWAMFALYYLIGLSSTGPTSFTRRISGVLEDNKFASRVDDLQMGLVDLVYEAIHNFQVYDNHHTSQYREPFQMY